MHFFIEHAKLTDQPSTEGFGPSSADPANKYDVSANFQLTEDAKALACQPGHIIVTDYFDVTAGALDPDLVNVILKPTTGVDVTFPTVRYYIYRGIKRDSFLTAGTFNAEGLSNTDTVRKMWEDWHKNVATSPDPLAPSDVGYDATLAGTTHIEEIFGKTAVTLAGAPLRARQISEGEWIGTFGSSEPICFEVIVEAELLNLNLEYASKSKVQIDISALRAIANPTPAQAHTLRCEKEKILAFVDPAALFGMHFSAGVSGFGEATAPKRDLLATKFLSHFSTATRVYLDIRSDKGYSYNFYDNYGGGGPNPDLIKFKPGAAAAFVDDVYFNQGWPLFSQSGWTGPAAKVNLSLRLRIDDNTKPLLFVEPTDRLPKGSKNFLDQKKLLNGVAVDWSKAINLKLDGSSPTGAKVCVSTHVRLQYLKQNTDAVANPRLLQFNHRLDTVFGGIDLPIVGSGGTVRELRNDKVGLAQGPDFAHVPDTGMYFDPGPDVVLLYGSSRVAYRDNDDFYPTPNPTTSPPGNVVLSPVFPGGTVLSPWLIVQGGTAIRLIDLSLYKKGTKNTSYNGIHFLGLTRDELIRLQPTSGFGPVHQRFLVFEEAADQLDDTGFPYKKYEVKVQGLNAAGQRKLVAPNPAVHVFGSGANMVCSSGFAGLVNVPEGLPDPAMKRQWEYIFAGNYGVGDLDVTAVSASGKVTVPDLGGNQGITDPTVKLRARYFYPIDAAPPLPPTAPPISIRKTSYPLVVIVHGNGQRFTEYNALGRHLAHNGFIVASISLLFIRPADPDSHGMATMGRTNVLFEHLRVLKHKFGASVADNVGLIGHSRGGEAVVRAADKIVVSSAPADLRQIKAVISLAPSDQYEKEDLSQDIPYFVLYGSRDADIAGERHERDTLTGNGLHAGSGGFSLYDRAVNPPGSPPMISKVKSMAFVYGASHNGFITSNTKDKPNIAYVSDQTQRATTRAYMNAFMRQHLLGEPKWKSYFTGEFIPGSTGWKKIFQQYKDMIPGNSQMLDNFEGVTHNWAVSSSGQPVSHSRLGTGLAEGFLNLHAPLDVDSPHETNGLKVTGWLAADTLTFTVLAGGLDVSGWTHFSFRITQVARRANSPINTMMVAIKDANNPAGSHEIVLNKAVPNPDPRPDDSTLQKSAFMTIRIPLAAYQSHVDLTKVQSVELRFPALGPGNIEIDDLEFTK